VSHHDEDDTSSEVIVVPEFVSGRGGEMRESQDCMLESQERVPPDRGSVGETLGAGVFDSAFISTISVHIKSLDHASVVASGV
jgi:hypothetical protein